MKLAFFSLWSCLSIRTSKADVPSSVWYDENVKCEQINGFNVCAIVPYRAVIGSGELPEAPSPSIASDILYSDAPSLVPTPTHVSTMIRVSEYSFLPMSFEGKDEDEIMDLNPPTLADVKVALYSDGGCTVAVDGEKCQACTHCGQERYTADCTNVPHGRTTACESAFVPVQGGGAFDIFFPLAGDSPAAFGKKSEKKQKVKGKKSKSEKKSEKSGKKEESKKEEKSKSESKKEENSKSEKSKK